jgi:hypothetical protein
MPATNDKNQQAVNKTHIVATNRNVARNQQQDQNAVLTEGNNPKFVVENPINHLVGATST